MREGRQHGARAACGSRGLMCLLVTVASLGMKYQREHVWLSRTCLVLGGHRHDFPPTHPVRFPRGAGGTLRAAGAWQRLSQPPTSQDEEEVGWVRKEPCEGAAGAGNHSF